MNGGACLVVFILRQGGWVEQIANKKRNSLGDCNDDVAEVRRPARLSSLGTGGYGDTDTLDHSFRTKSLPKIS